MRQEEKRKIIARKVMTILIMAVSLASVSFACTAYAETMLRQETIVYEKVEGGLKQIESITSEKEEEQEAPQAFREEQRELAMKEQEDNYSCFEQIKIKIKEAIEQLEQKASGCLYSLMV